MRVCALLALLAAPACGGRAGPEGAARPSGRAGVGVQAATIFADEFSGSALDRAKWTVYTGPVYNDELQEYVDDRANVYIAHGAEAAGASGGVLVIRAHHRPRDAGDGRRADFTSGRLHGRLAFQYGTVAARMKLPAGAGLWPAFWLLGAGAWPASGEIDVMENVGDPAWVSVALHGPGYSGATPLLHRAPLPPTRDATDWHEYAVTWTAESILFRIDGAPVYRVRRVHVAPYGPPEALDSAKYVVLNLALGGTYPAAVNGVRSPYLGLPSSSVQKVTRGEARLLVDWVRATR